MMRNRQRLHLGRFARMGAQLGVVVITALAVAGIAGLAWEVWQTREGFPGGEALVLPLFGLLLACGWMARGDLERYRAYKRHQERGKRKSEGRSRPSAARCEGIKKQPPHEGATTNQPKYTR